ncbi:MAG: poly-gamma-glutamate biosynthesis protein PgsC/CapC [Synergistaceae bacterium]|nr:poly-gamma-glutamate biosynthesis protein PgsC/CapC [Synergistaceae bacterium]
MGNVTLTLALGIAASMLWDRRTGFASGGLIAPGVIALSLYDPMRLTAGLAISFAVYVALDFLVRHFSLYGRFRIGAAMLLALALQALCGEYFPSDSFWFGWVVPGLVAADMQRQGVLRTITSLFICAIAVGFSVELFMFCAGAL